jgi:hypothetical protein
MTLLDVVRNLRERLVKAHHENNLDEADRLFTLFDELVQMSYESQNSQLIEVLLHLRDSAGDILNGSRAKSTIPSIEELRSVFASPSSEAS